MPAPPVALEKLGFLTIGSFGGADPGPGHPRTLEVIELGERLGFDSAWVRHRHLQLGSPPPSPSSPPPPSARGASNSAPRRTSQSRRQCRPIQALGRRRGDLYPDTAEIEDFSYERDARLLRLVGGEPAARTG